MYQSRLYEAHLKKTRMKWYAGTPLCERVEQIYIHEECLYFQTATELLTSMWRPEFHPMRKKENLLNTCVGHLHSRNWQEFETHITKHKSNDEGWKNHHCHTYLDNTEHAILTNQSRLCELESNWQTYDQRNDVVSSMANTMIYVPRLLSEPILTGRGHSMPLTFSTRCRVV